MMTPTAEKAVSAYGGADRWKKARNIEAEVSVRGLAFTLKWRPFFRRALIHMAVDRPFSRLTPIGRDGNITGVRDGGDVRLEDAGGTIIAERKDARTYFPGGRRLWFWDDLDMAYFANYAFWNYFTLPRLLMNSDIEWREKSAGLMEAVFPESLPTHNRVQEFRFDTATGLLVQHNYTAEIISGLAKAAHVVAAHAGEDGLVYPSARRVTPRTKQGRALGGPVLIDITVHSFRLG